MEVDYNGLTGDVRYLTADGAGLSTAAFTGDAVKFASDYLAQIDTIAALDLSDVSLVQTDKTEFPFGTRVEFSQTLTVADHPGALPVRGGFIHVFIDKQGQIRQVESSVRRGKKPVKLGTIISQDKAIAKAKAKHVTKVCEVRSCTLVLSSHEAKSQRAGSKPKLVLDPTYEVILHSCNPASQTLYLVDARQGKVVHKEEKLHFFSQVSPAQKAATEPAAKYFPVTPDPKVALPKQVIDYTIADLTDPTKLENKRFTMFIQKGGNWVVPQAKADGSFNYGIKDPEFEAVVIFIALNEATKMQEAWGMPKIPTPIPVYVSDPAVQDNAYFDPSAMEIHIGVGSGVPNGLRTNIAFDKMVERHEFNGHGMVTLTTPGHDLPGAQGGGLHEKAGDWAALIFEYLDAVKFAKQINRPWGVAEVQKDPRIIGPYSLDGGIRVMRNTKKYPGDITNEVHSDGEIPGGACGDLLQAVIEKENDVAKGAEICGKLQVASLALVPSHKVLFTDELRAMITADQTLFQGAYRQLIEKAHADHGITLSNTPPKKRTPKKRKPGKNRRRRS